MSFRTFAFLCWLILLVNGCAKPQSLYARIGGQPVIDIVAGNFTNEISFSNTIFPYFSETNVDKFQASLATHLCDVAGGPCSYTGDSMQQVHAGMQITKNDFNKVVELLQIAMKKAGVAYPLQNELIAKLAPMRKDIIESKNNDKR